MSSAAAAAPLRPTFGGLQRLTAAQKSEARLVALRIVRDEQYQAQLEERAKRGLLPPPIEQMLWHYAYGKPPDRLELGRIGDSDALAELSREELLARAQALVAFLQAGPAAAAAPPLPAARQETDDALASRVLQQLRFPPLREIGDALEEADALDTALDEAEALDA